MKRVALFSPLPPSASGIADYTSDLLPSLAEDLDLEVYVDGECDHQPKLGRDVRVHNWHVFEKEQRRQGYDAIVYQMGNSEHHHYMYPFALRYPGVLVLHELVLHHLVFGLTGGAGHWPLYVLSMLDSHGRDGLIGARRVAVEGGAPEFFEFPLSSGVVRRSRAVIVHSQFMRDALCRMAPHIPTQVVPQVAVETPVGAPDTACSAAARRELGLPPDGYHIGAFGLVTPNKRLDVVLRAVRQLLTNVPRAYLVVVGEISPAWNFQALIHELGINQHVILTGRTSLEDFHRYMDAMDVTVALRYPTAGETSGSLIRMLAAGKPTITSRVGWFAELPEVVCLQIEVDEFEEQTLVAMLRLLYQRPDLRRQLAANAQAYARRHHSLDATTHGYLEVIRDVADGAQRINDDELTQAFFQTFIADHALEEQLKTNCHGSNHVVTQPSIPYVFTGHLARRLVDSDLVPEFGSAFEKTLAEGMLSLTRARRTAEPSHAQHADTGSH